MNDKKKALKEYLIRDIELNLVAALTTGVIILGIIISSFSLNRLFTQNYSDDYYSSLYIIVNSIRVFILPGIILFILNLIMAKSMHCTIIEKLKKDRYYEATKANKKVYLRNSLIVPVIFCLLLIILKEDLLIILGSEGLNQYGFLLKRAWIIIPIITLIEGLVAYTTTSRLSVKHKIKENNEKEIKVRTIEENLNKNLKNELEEIDKKYENIIAKKELDQYSSNTIYDNSNLSNIIDSNEERGLDLEIINNKLLFNQNTKYINRYDNSEKEVQINKQINKLKHKYNVDDISNIKRVFNMDMDMESFRNKVSVCQHQNSIARYNSKFLEKINNTLNNLNIKNEYKINNDLTYYMYKRSAYLSKESNSLRLGREGEEIVNRYLLPYKDEVINIISKTINLGKFDYLHANHKMECDNILITPYGVFVLEVKNVGVSGRFKIRIEKSGRWVNKRLNDETIKVWDRTPIKQNADHVLNLKNILNKTLNRDFDDENYIDPIGVVVIANNEVTIEFEDPEDDSPVYVVDSLYDKMKERAMKLNAKRLSKSEMLEIKEILDNIQGEEHSPMTFRTINVVEEISNIEKTLTKYYELEKINNLLGQLNNELESYYREIGEAVNKSKENFNNEKSKIS